MILTNDDDDGRRNGWMKTKMGWEIYLMKNEATGYLKKSLLFIIVLFSFWNDTITFGNIT